MDAGRQGLTLLPARIEAVPSPRAASFDVLRLCANEREAALVSIRMSKLSQAEIAKRIGVSKQAISKWLLEGVPGGRVRAFGNATGTTLLAQYHGLQKAMRDADGVPRECDRIDRIASLAMAA